MLLSIHLTPKAKTSGIRSTMADGTLKVSVRAVPEDGKANAELCRLLSDHYQVPISAVRVLRGHTSRRKVVEILNPSMPPVAHQTH